MSVSVQAKHRLETIIANSNSRLQQAFAYLLLAELFNKWGAASSAYTVEVAAEGAHFAIEAVALLDKELTIAGEWQLGSNSDMVDDTKSHFVQALYWKVLNLATVGRLGGSEAHATRAAFQEAEDALERLKHLRALADKDGARMKFLAATVLFCRGTAMLNGFLSVEEVGEGETGDGSSRPAVIDAYNAVLNRCLVMYDHSYAELSKGEVLGEALIKTVTMIGVCHMSLGNVENAIKWTSTEVELRTRLHGPRNARTQKACRMLATLQGGRAEIYRGSQPLDLSDESLLLRYPIEKVTEDELVWEIDPFQARTRWTVSAVLRMFLSLGLVSHFEIPVATLTRFVLKCRDLYHKQNPFHNWRHAWSVTHCAYMILKTSGIGEKLRREEVLAIMISCLVHDLDHPGVSSDFLIKSGSMLALQFPTKNVLEQMHFDQARLILLEGATDILVNLEACSKKSVMWLVFKGVMSTDMGNHKRIVTSLKSRSERLTAAKPSEDAAASAPSCGLETAYDFGNEEDRLEIVEAIVHAADLSGQALPQAVAYEFGRRVLKEFHSQSQREKRDHLPVTAFMTNLDDILVQAKVQLGFLNYVVEPLWNSLSCILPQIKSRHEAVLERLAEIHFDDLERWPGQCGGLCQNEVFGPASSSSDESVDRP